MPAAYRAHAQTISGTNPSSIVIPATVQVGDILVLYAAGGWGPVMPGGWTSIYSDLSSANIRGFVAYKTAVLGDIGATVSVTWQGAYAHAINLLAVSGATGVRAGSVIAHNPSGGSSASLGPVPAAAGDVVVFVGGARQSGGAPIIASGVTDASAADGGNLFGGVVGHLEIATSSLVGNTFSTPGSGAYLYAVVVVSGGGTPANFAMVESNYVEAMTVPQANAQVEVDYLEVATGGLAPVQVESLYMESVLTGAASLQVETVYNEILVSTQTAMMFKGWGIPIRD